MQAAELKTMLKLAEVGTRELAHQSDLKIKCDFNAQISVILKSICVTSK